MPYDIIKGTDSIVKKLVYGLSPLKHWTDDSMGMRNTLMAPRLVVEYNLHMSAVNRADHVCTICPVEQKERQGIMAFFTFCMD